MKLLLDQNISFKVSKKLKTNIPELFHISDFDLLNSQDEEIWKFAKRENYTIITFDADFYDLQTLLGFPPKIIWLRFGNTTTSKMIDFIRTNISSIRNFITSEDFDDIGCLEFYNLS
ncbi:MAG: DUF5615 family PIN-like protein [Gracilimonas sp.]|nr:DUF5615 family PIN-like protein [Gracilimonas sp.]